MYKGHMTKTISTQFLSEFNLYLKQKADILFPVENELNQAIRYSLLAEGKRIRPLFAMGFCEAFKGDQKMAMACGLAVEMIHAYSLIHDDLPAMDNDDFRRGKPTNHKVFGEAKAILAGDALLNAAPEFLINELQNLNVKPELILKITTLLLKASGHQGMIKGQALDIQCEMNLPPVDAQKNILREIHLNKTGQLIAWSCLAGLYSCGDINFSSTNIQKVEKIGHDFGLLFQIIDDLLDVTASLEDLGKTPGKDAKSGKLTYISLYGKEMTTKLAIKIISDIECELLNLENGKSLKEILQTLKDKIP